MYKKLGFFLSIVVAMVLAGAGCINLGGSTATGPTGMFRSGDKGESWQQITTYPTAQGVQSIAGVRVTKLFNDPSDPKAFYLGSRGQGLYYTYDSGNTWQSFSQLAGKFIYSVAVDPKNKCNIYASDGANIYQTNDCGRNWGLSYTEQLSGTNVIALGVDYGDSRKIYAAEDTGDVLQSDNWGQGWHVVKRFSFSLKDMVVDNNQSGRIYVAAAARGLWRSDDGGSNWIDLNQAFASYSNSTQFFRLVLNPAQANSLFWISKYGILRSDDAGSTWTDLKLITPPGSVDIYGFSINPVNQKEIYYTGTILNSDGTPVRSTFYRSTDGGVNWVTKKLPTNTIPVTMRMPPDGSQLFLGFTLLK